MLGKPQSEHPLDRAARQAGVTRGQFQADMEAGIARTTNVRGRFNTMTDRDLADYRAVVQQRRQQVERERISEARREDRERRQAEAAELLQRAQRLVGGAG